MAQDDAIEIPRVALGFMNETHAEEVSMVMEITELVKLVKAGCGDVSKLTTDLAAWLQHTSEHFARENKLMADTGFPAIDVHINEHDIALNKLEAVIAAWNENGDIDLLSDYILVLWPPWFTAHVNTMDAATAQFAVMKGYQHKATG